MTSSIVLSGLLADVVILLVLAAALASPTISPLPRVLMATLAFMFSWLLTAVSDALQAPGWAIVAGSGVVATSIAAVIYSVHLWTMAGERGESGDQPRTDDGGGGPRREWDAPQRGGDGEDPSWWPEFERQLRSYVAERDRGTQRPRCLARPR